MTNAQRTRLLSVELKPWSGLLNYFRTMKAEWDALLGLGYVTAQMLSSSQGVEVWEYTITEAGRAALVATKAPARG